MTLAPTPIGVEREYASLPDLVAGNEPRRLAYLGERVSFGRWVAPDTEVLISYCVPTGEFIATTYNRCGSGYDGVRYEVIARLDPPSAEGAEALLDGWEEARASGATVTWVRERLLPPPQREEPSPAPRARPSPLAE